MSIEEELRQIAAEQRTLGERLQQILARIDSGSDALGEGWPVFDPDVDEPPVQPDINGNRRQLDWVSILLWSKLAAINAREGRGASRDEYIQFSKDAGYRDGRGWNAWEGYLDLADGRWIDEAGFKHLTTFYEKQQHAVPRDILDWQAKGGFAQ